MCVGGGGERGRKVKDKGHKRSGEGAGVPGNPDSQLEFL